MAIDARIPLGVQVPDIGGSIMDFAKEKKRQQEREEDKERQDEKDERQKEKDELAMAAARINIADAREKQRFNNLVFDSVQINQALRNGDMDTARQVLESRKQKLLKLQEAHPDLIDTTETDEALQLLEQNPGALFKRTQQVIKLAERTGALEKAEKNTFTLGEGDKLVDDEGNLIAENPSQVKATSDIGKLRQDFQNDLITPDEYKKALSQELNPAGDLKTAAEIKQMLEIERAIAELKEEVKAGSEKSKKELEKLEKDLELKEKELEEKKEEEIVQRAKAENNAESAFEKATIVKNKVNDALKMLGAQLESELKPGQEPSNEGKGTFFKTGFTGQVLSNIGGTEAFNLEQTINTIKANLGFQELTAMREASPTGGALGQVSEREINFLQSTVASLDVGQDPKILIKNLREVKTHMDKWLETVKGSFFSQYGELPDVFQESGGDTGNVRRYDEQGNRVE